MDCHDNNCGCDDYIDTTDYSRSYDYVESSNSYYSYSRPTSSSGGSGLETLFGMLAYLALVGGFLFFFFWIIS